MDVTPQLLKDVEFRQSLRGYDPDEVDLFLQRVGAGVAQLQGRLAEAISRAEAAESRIDRGETPAKAKAQSASGKQPTEETITRTLLLAQQTADKLLAEARDEAASTLADSQAEAERLRSTAQVETEELRAETQAETNELRATTEAEVRDLRSSAEADAAAQRGEAEQILTTAVTSAEQERMAVLGDVESEARRVAEETREPLLAEIRTLEDQRAALRDDVGLLEAHVDEQRGLIRSSIGRLQSVVDNPETLRIAEAPAVSEYSSATAEAVHIETNPVYQNGPIDLTDSPDDTGSADNSGSSGNGPDDAPSAAVEDEAVDEITADHAQPVSAVAVEEAPVEEVASEEPAAEEPAAEEPAAEEMVSEELTVEEVTAEESAVEEVIDEPAVLDEETADESAGQEIVAEETVSEASRAEETSVEETSVEETSTEETGAEETVAAPTDSILDQFGAPEPVGAEVDQSETASQVFDIESEDVADDLGFVEPVGAENIDLTTPAVSSAEAVEDEVVPAFDNDDFFTSEANEDRVDVIDLTNSGDAGLDAGEPTQAFSTVASSEEPATGDAFLDELRRAVGDDEIVDEDPAMVAFFDDDTEGPTRRFGRGS